MAVFPLGHYIWDRLLAHLTCSSGASLQRPPGSEDRDIRRLPLNSPPSLVCFLNPSPNPPAGLSWFVFCAISVDRFFLIRQEFLAKHVLRLHITKVTVATIYTTPFPSLGFVIHTIIPFHNSCCVYSPALSKMVPSISNTILPLGAYHCKALIVDNLTE